MNLSEEIQSVLLKTIKPGIYRGLVANTVGKQCVEALLNHLKGRLKTLSAFEVIKEGYRIHEEYAFAKFDPRGEIFLSQKYNHEFPDRSQFEKAITKLGTNSRFLVEAGLSFGGSSGIPSEEDEDYLAKITDYIVTWAKNLDFFYYSGKLFSDFKLEVTRGGDLLFTHDQKLVNQKESVIRKFAKEREEAHIATLLGLRHTKGEKISLETYSVVDEAYKSRFGYKFTDALRFLSTIPSMLPRSRPFGICVYHRKKLLKKLSEKADFSMEKTEKIFKDFEITKGGLKTEGFPNWRLKRKFSLLWRPIVSVSMEKRKIYSITGKITPIGNLSMFITSLEGFLNLGKATEKIRLRKAKTFERDIAVALESLDFKTQSNVRTPKGEIDIVAITGNLILVVECKSPTVKIDAREHTQDLLDSQKWEKKLERKVNWVEKNREEIFEQALGKRPEDSSLSVKGVIVTQRPFYDIFGQQFEIIFRSDFPEWLGKLTWI